MPSATNNLLLDALSSESRAQIVGSADEFDLPIRSPFNAQGQMPRYACFLTSGIASMVVGSGRGESAETCLIGHEGVTGAFSLLGSLEPPAECYMQVAGSGYRILLSDLRRLFMSSEEIRSRILECVQQQGMTTNQLVACNRLHEAEPRLARWLLMVQDRTQAESFGLTQEFLALMLGTRRTTVALIAGDLQRDGLIEYTRGKVKILARKKLEALCCDCYGVTRRLFSGLYTRPYLTTANEADTVRSKGPRAR